MNRSITYTFYILLLNLYSTIDYPVDLCLYISEKLTIPFSTLLGLNTSKLVLGDKSLGLYLSSDYSSVSHALKSVRSSPIDIMFSKLLTSSIYIFCSYFCSIYMSECGSII